MKTIKPNKKDGSIREFAGAWKDLSEEDFKRIKDAIKRGRKDGRSLKYLSKMFRN